MQLNKDLVNPKDVEIAKLKHKIEQFKKYDKERTEYYSELATNYAANEEYIKELEEGNEGKVYAELKEQIKKLKEENAHLKKIDQRRLDQIQNANIILWTDDEYKMYKQMHQIQRDSVIKENVTLREQLKRKNDTVNSLIIQLNEFRKNQEEV